ncbi:MAG TPA: hypothetical protein EYQ06_06215 [Flavobacteriales bacterium]|nr:hypothetical protein [Flavobacteriales bacterium]
MEITDKESHDLQNRLDQVIGDLDLGASGMYLAKLIEDLRNIRDDLPCSCGEEDIDADREMQRERNFDRVQQSIETGGTDY